MTPQSVQSLFTQNDGTYLFARWGRPIVPVIFGLDDASLVPFKSAIEAVVALAGHQMAETDPEFGANLMLFFIRDWAELPAVPKLDHLVPDLPALCGRLQAAQAHHYRLFRFDAAGAIKAAFVFVRFGTEMSQTPAQDLALAEAAQMILLWGPKAFDETTCLARMDDVVILHPQIAAVIRAAYAPTMPAAARDAAHGLRLAARVAMALDAQAG